MRFSAINALVILGSLTLASAENKKCIVKNTSKNSVEVPGINNNVKAMVNNLVEEIPVEEKPVKNAFELQSDVDSDDEPTETLVTVTVDEEETVTVFTEVENGSESETEKAEKAVPTNVADEESNETEVTASADNDSDSEAENVTASVEAENDSESETENVEKFVDPTKDVDSESESETESAEPAKPTEPTENTSVGAATEVEEPTEAPTEATTDVPEIPIVSSGPITVRFQKPKTWESVCLWSWDGANNLYGGPDWPGKPIKDLGNGWWSHTFDDSVTVANVIFNNCDGENTIKTNDITNVVTNTCFKLVGTVIIKTTDCGLDLDMCVADANERIQCGSDKISKEDCIAQSCCYSELAGAPSCFYGKGSDYNNQYGTCIVDHTLRSRCGAKDITQDQCADLGCCWDLAEDNDYPSCFYHGALQPTCSVDQYQRKACGYAGITEDECTEKFGCCYNPNGLSEETFCYYQDVIPSGSDIEPECPNKYKVKGLKKTSNGMTATLDLGGAKCEKYDADIQKLALKVTYETDSRLHIHVQPEEIEKYPHNTDIPAAAYPFEVENEAINDPLYSFELEEDGDFDIVVKRKSGETIFNTKPNEFVFEQQFLQLKTDVPVNANIYGFGEVVSNFKRNANATRQAMFALDVACPYDQNVYGAHPFYVEIAKDGSAYGVFLKNAHGMDFILEPGKLAYRINGGNIDLYFFMGPTVQDVIAQYYKVIGQPALMPYWPLGFHQCRYGYPNIDKVESVVAEYKKQQIPLDTMWIDIDYMDNYKDFTYDPVNFPVERIQKFVDNLHANHQYYINMIDPAISTDPEYPTFQRGVEKDIFVKNASGDLFRGKVWPGETVFPDFHHPNVLEYWTNEIRLFKKIANTDGNWFDMNEAANFCNGECAGSKTTKNYKFGEFNPNKPPYGIFDHKSNATPLNYKNLDMDATYYGGLIEYDIHNIYGHMESVVSYQAFLNIDPVKRPFILSRSTFSGSGKYVAHWLGDNYSTWDYLATSIPGMLNFQMFGIPLVGSDICGFNNDANEELCTRWMELGAFYPFARNHNGKGQVSQEPFEWKSTAEASRRALAIRYELLPYWYTNMVRAHTDSYMMLTPLAFDWPTDTVALDDDKQFLVGRAVMVTPVLTEGATSVNGYFPAGKWYNWYNPTESFEGPTYKNLDAPLEHIPVHIRGGFVIPVQGPKLTVYENRNSPFGLIVALDAKNKASGEIYLDDGVSIDIKGKKTEVKYTVENNTLTASGSYKYKEAHPLNTIRVLGVAKKPSKVVVEQKKSRTLDFTYDGEVLTIKNAKIDMNSDFKVNWA